MPPNILLFYCSNLWALTTSALNFYPVYFCAPNCKRGGHKQARSPFIFFNPTRLILHIVVSRIQVNARPISTATTFAPKITKGGYLYTPQIKLGRILNNSRFGRLYGVFLRRRHSAFLQIAPITALPPVPAVFFLQMARISPPPSRSARYQKLSNPPLPLFARSANYTRFLRLIFFRHELAVLQNCTHFYIFYLFAKNSSFLRAAILRAFLAFFIFAPIFQKQEFFAHAKNQAPF